MALGHMSGYLVTWHLATHPGRGMVWYGREWNMMHYGMVWHGVWYGVVWYNMYGMVWYGMV